MDEGLSEPPGLADDPPCDWDDAIRILREHESEIRAEGVTRLELLGVEAEVAERDRLNRFLREAILAEALGIFANGGGGHDRRGGTRRAELGGAALAWPARKPRGVTIAGPFHPDRNGAKPACLKQAGRPSA